MPHHWLQIFHRSCFISCWLNKCDTLALHWPDHISLQTLERMSLATMNDTVSGQTALHYKVCIFSKAIIFVSRWLRLCSPGILADNLEKSREKYIAACLECLTLIDFSRSPSLSMLQALLCGASLVQLLGDTTRSWHMTSLASRALVALGYHSSTAVTQSDDHDESEVRRCIYWCYYMDKTLSMLLARPSSLPVLPFHPIDLVDTDPEYPLSYKVRILVKLAQVQDNSLFLMMRDRKQNLTEAHESALVENLHVELRFISEEIRQYRTEYADHPTLKIEWDAVDFTFFSIATGILRFDSLPSHNHKRREECLRYARKALFAMQACQRHISTPSTITTDFLFWTVLLYPMTPFFVIFCNVVATSNQEDFELLKEVTSMISRIKDQCTFGLNLHRLLSELINLCSNLHDRHLSDGSDNNKFHVHSSRYGNISKDFETQASFLTVPVEEGSSAPTLSSPDQQAANYDNYYEQRGNTTIWNEGLMWELYNTQPSVEWLNSIL
ncbi:hypothetical protein ASPWEDRAFT_305901 [Aspergillus wentii DTO 134E9]|uniref:Xylanolytic transcriptional activator regulatory domain-containing protein n=1 Tax=Aspergillus wentii DTO 134E9 TaxID=1073089 RepID=A0A1L9R3U5_ASPWE|nr:uncharacterized protein ASPWEDRAFT_305901 [Aspergillus wentii DTO 134E9]OJJ29599.1 hypothetical protein ASPWEDRAFT_305901 [Aspergillus wentii DTO 134E9]